MLSVVVGRTRVECSAFFLALLAFSVAYKDNGLLLLGLGSMFLHEMGHLLAMRLQGIGVRRIVFGLGRITIDPLQAADMLQQVFVLAAGPLANLLVSALFFRLGWRYAAYMNVALAIINLVPAGSLDGGRLVYAAALQVLGARTAFWILTLLSALFGGAILCAGIRQFFLWGNSPALLLFGSFILLSAFQKLRYTKPS